MGSRKKRKSAGPAEEQPPPAKRPSSQQGRRSGGSGGGGSAAPGLTWGPDSLTVSLPADQALVFLGRALLEVQSGEVTALGAVFTAASGAAELAADDRCGGALLLEPGAGQGTVPLAASSGAVLTLTRVPAGTCGSGAAGPPATPQRQVDDAASSDVGSSRWRQLGFEAWLSSDPAAPPVPPPLPPLWRQAAAEVEETLAAAQQQQQQQLQQQGGQLPVIVVAGAKKVGKSTFARFLVNSLLARHGCVAYLDTDCGQPEFTAPGLVSITLVTRPVLGPAHMHLRRPAASFFVGDVSPANDPARYLQYTCQLAAWYRQHGAAAAAAAVAAGGSAASAAAAAAAGIGAAPQPEQLQLPPLVVNTHGWVKGMGFDVLVELLQGLPVTHMVQLAASNPKKDLPPGSFWLADGPADPQQQQQQQQQQQPEVLHWLLPGLGGDAQAQPAASETSARSVATAGTAGTAGGGDGRGGGGGGGRGRLNAVEQRALQWEALAQQCIDNCGLCSQPAGAAGGKAGAAAAAAAVAGPGSDLGDRLAAAVPFEVDAADVEVQVLHSAVPPSQLYYALNGAVVGLCAAPQQPQQQQQQQQQQQFEMAGPAGGPPALPCLGLGIVRAADARRRCLHVLTAVPEEELEAVVALQLGKLELPASLLQTGAHLARNLCLFSLTGAGTGAGAIRSRNNLLRQSQL